MTRSGRQPTGLYEAWRAQPVAPRGMPAAALAAIARRRRQILVHSAIYYGLNDNLVTDDVWQHWADQLVQLHDKFGNQIKFYDQAFEDWDASTGMHLPQDAGILSVAKRLIQYRDDYHADNQEILYGKRSAPAGRQTATRSKRRGK